MTKTFTPVVLYRSVHLWLTVIVTLVATIDGSVILNFEFGSLGFIWDLIFGAWNFVSLHKQVLFE